MKPELVRCYVLFSTIIAAVTFSACKEDKKDAAAAAGRPKGVTADVYVVREVPFSESYTASGSLLPNEEVSLMPEMSGRVTGIYFREGGAVRKGQTLVQLSDADLQATLLKLRAQRRLQQTTAGRQRELVRIGGISRQEYDATQTGVQAIDADIAAVEAQMRRLRIVAPFDGTVGLRNVSNGAVVTPSTALATLQQTGVLKLDFSIPETYRDKIAVGLPVTFTIDGNPDSLKGRIVATDPGASMSTRTIRVRATVANPGGKLNPGAFATVFVPVSGSGNSILVPAASIIPTTRDRKVAVVRKGKASLIPVETGTRTSDQVVIVSGLKSGDTVLTTGIMQVRDGMDVKVRKVL